MKLICQYCQKTEVIDKINGIVKSYTPVHKTIICNECNERLHILEKQILENQQKKE